MGSAAAQEATRTSSPDPVEGADRDSELRQAIAMSLVDQGAAVGGGTGAVGGGADGLQGGAGTWRGGPGRLAGRADVHGGEASLAHCAGDRRIAPAAAAARAARARAVGTQDAKAKEVGLSGEALLQQSQLLQEKAREVKAALDISFERAEQAIWGDGHN